MLEPVTIAAIIAASTSVFTCFIGVKVGRTRLFSPYQKEFLERQIFEFLAPLEKMLTFSTAKDWKTIRFDLTLLVKENYALVPPLVLSECFPLLSHEQITDEQFLKLRAAVSSIYNWTRREIGHSYDRAKIKKEFIPANETIEKVEILFAVIVVFVTLFFGMLFWLSFVPQEKFEQIKSGIIISLILVVLYLCWVLLIRIFKK